MPKVTKAEFDNFKSQTRKEGEDCNCPVWYNKGALGHEYAVSLPSRDYYWSPRAGGFFQLHSRARRFWTGIESKKRVSSWIWQRNNAFGKLGENKRAEMPAISEELAREIAAQSLPSTEERIDRALWEIGEPPRALEGPIGFLNGEFRTNENESSLFQAATCCGTDLAEMNWLLDELLAAGLIRNTSSEKHIPKYMLTLKGLHRLETGGEALVSNNAFVAMWFDDDVSMAFEQGIEPAIRNAGFAPLRIDRKHHVGKIDDEIVAQIRRSRFIVCDLTSSLLDDPDAESGKTPVARGGVYYEAGFAHGLGKKVIWTCRRDVVEHIHFDLRQYNCILWERGKEEELQEDLNTRIRAVIV